MKPGIHLFWVMPAAAVPGRFPAEAASARSGRIRNDPADDAATPDLGEPVASWSLLGGIAGLGYAVVR